MMSSRRDERGNPMPNVDEGWWQSVLAEEGRGEGRDSGRQHARGGARHEARGREGNKITPNWARVKELYQNDQVVSLLVTGTNRGGLLVEAEGLYGFVPFSHLVEIAAQVEPLERSKVMENYVGRTLQLKVIECVPEDGRIVFSERAAQAGPGKRTELFHTLRSGERVTGAVTNITDFGVFVDLGGVEGLIHISELSWGRVVHPSQIVKMGETVEVEVLELSPERCRVALSLKRLLPNPWIDINTALPIGQTFPAVITSVLSYGAFARLARGVEGLIHASEMPLDEGQSVKDLLHEGQEVQVRVMHVDATHQRMGLSMKPGS